MVETIETAEGVRKLMTLKTQQKRKTNFQSLKNFFLRREDLERQG